MRIETSISEAIRRIAGDGISITHSMKISGGDINEASMLILSNGRRVFLKSNKTKGIDFFEAEAQGLSAIFDTNTIAVPEVLGIGNDPNAGTFLILNYIENSKKADDYWIVFAEELGAMHKADTTKYVIDGEYGFLADNYIGSREQINTPYDSWIEFFRDCRLSPRFEGANSYFDSQMIRSINRLLDNLDKWLIEPERPSLLHGDLWSGNAITGSNGKAWLIDPAVYVGFGCVLDTMEKLLLMVVYGIMTVYTMSTDLKRQKNSFASIKEIIYWQTYNYKPKRHMILYSGPAL